MREWLCGISRFGQASLNPRTSPAILLGLTSAWQAVRCGPSRIAGPCYSAGGTAGLSPNCVLLFENQYARVYAIRVAAGGEQPQHCQRDCLVVCLSGAEMRCILPDGGSEVESLKTDQIAWRAAATQQRQNVAGTELWEIAVEPK